MTTRHTQHEPTPAAPLADLEPKDDREVKGGGLPPIRGTPTGSTGRPVEP